MDIDKLIDNIDSTNLSIAFGRIKNISTTTLNATGLEVAVGDIVKIESVQHLYTVLGMVASISADSFTIVPFSFIDGFRIQDKVYIQKDGLTVKCGYGLLGRVINALGEPIDNKGKITDLEENAAINKLSMPALERGIIDEKFATGVKAIDSMLTSGKGQKVGIFAGSGVGKSTLMGMIVKGCEAQIKVVALIGERGREIPEFIHYNLDNNLENTVIVAATSDESALMRKYGAFTAMAIAEFFRDKGAFDVGHKNHVYFNMLFEFYKEKGFENSDIFTEYLKYDYFYMEKPKIIPYWLVRNSDKDFYNEILKTKTDRHIRELYKITEYEIFNVDVKNNKLEQKKLLFKYDKNRVVEEIN